MHSDSFSHFIALAYCVVFLFGISLSTISLIRGRISGEKISKGMLDACSIPLWTWLFRPSELKHPTFKDGALQMVRLGLFVALLGLLFESHFIFFGEYW